MKAASIFLSVLFLTATCSPSKKEITASTSVQEAFKRLHPNATILEWKDESPTWEAKYQEGDVMGAVSFDTAGTVTETELVISQELLPNFEGIQDYITTNYPGEKVQRYEKITTADGKITFEIQINGKELVFDSDGKFLEEERD